MKFLQITNIYPLFGGNVDYKGLDIDLFVSGTPIYPENENFCYVATNEEIIPNHPEIAEISEENYMTIHTNYKQAIEAKKVSLVEQQNLMQAALDNIILNGGI